MRVLELKVPPLAIVAVFAAAMWGLAELTPSRVIELPWREPLSLVLMLLGAAFAATGVIQFRRVGTTTNPLSPDTASTIVATGVYRVSRNPMYLGFLFVLSAWVIYLAHPLAALLLPLFVAYMNSFQIVPEERMLAAKFGEGYLRYRKRVRRWI